MPTLSNTLKGLSTLPSPRKIILWEDGRGNLEEVGDSVDPLPVDDGGNTVPAGEDVWL